jgi:hypothetical protein
MNLKKKSIRKKTKKITLMEAINSMLFFLKKEIINFLYIKISHLLDN